LIVHPQLYNFPGIVWRATTVQRLALLHHCKH
jgi:hypothetical protein